MLITSPSALAIRVVLLGFIAAVLLVALIQRIGAQDKANQPSMASPYLLEGQAMKAYEAKQYSESGRYFDAAFAAGLSRADDAYNAACSHALAGNSTKALGYLDRSASSGFREPDRMKADPDLKSVRSDSRFDSIINRVRANQLEYEQQHRDPDKAAIVTSDIDLFWAAYDRLRTSADPESPTCISWSAG